MDSPIIQRALFLIVALVVVSCARLSGPEQPVAGPVFEVIARDDPTDLGAATRPCTLQDKCKSTQLRTAACCR